MTPKTLEEGKNGRVAWERDLAREMRAEARKDWRKAFACLWRRDAWCDDLCDGDFLRGSVLRVGCAFAMLFNRQRTDDEGLGDWLTLAAFDYKRLYAGYSETLLSYNPKRLRFEIFSDGEWNM